MEVIGETDTKCLIILKTLNKKSSSSETGLELLLFNPHEKRREEELSLLLKCSLPPQRSIHQASLQVLTQTSLTSQSLLTLVYRERCQKPEEESLSNEDVYAYSASIFLIENLNRNFGSSNGSAYGSGSGSGSSSGDNSPNNSIAAPTFASIVILEEIELVKEQKAELRVYLLPTVRANLDIEDVSGSKVDLNSSQLSINQIISFKNQVVALSLEECKQ
jgi:hypothetical protein